MTFNWLDGNVLEFKSIYFVEIIRNLYCFSFVLKQSAAATLGLRSILESFFRELLMGFNRNEDKCISNSTRKLEHNGIQRLEFITRSKTSLCTFLLLIQFFLRYRIGTSKEQKKMFSRKADPLYWNSEGRKLLLSTFLWVRFKRWN